MKVKILRAESELVPQEKLSRNLFLASLVFLVAATTVILLFWLKLPSKVPIFYSRPWGEEQLGAPISLFLPLVLASLFLIVNALLAAKNREVGFVKRALIIGATSASILAAVTVVRIVLLII